MTQTWLKCPEMTHEQWLSWRRNGIGGSDAPGIMGDSSWATPYKIWEEKVLNPKKEDNYAMGRGRALEPVARAEFERLMNVKVSTANVEAKDWLRASLDGIDDNGKIMVEIKCPNKEDHAIASQYKMIPAKYYAQCQHQLAVTGLPGMYYFSFDGTEGSIVEVIRDDHYIDLKLLPTEKAFWDKVLSKEPPALIAKDFIDRSKNKEFMKAERRKLETKELLERAKEEDDKARETLIELADDHSAQGTLLKLTKYIAKGAIDYKQAITDYLDNMRSHYPDIPFKDIPTEPYRKDPFVKWVINDM